VAVPFSADEVVAGAALFADLQASEQAEIAALLHPVEFAPGDVLFREGEIADRLYLLTRGRIAVQIGTGERLLVAGTVGPGGSLGEMALAGSAPRSGTATAVQSTAGFYLEIGDFDVIRSIGRPLAAKVLRRLALELCADVREATAAVDDGGAGKAVGRRPAAAPRAARGEPRPAGPERLEVLRHSSFFSGFDGDELERMLLRLRESSAAAGEVIFGEGEPAASCLVVAEGTVDISLGGTRATTRLATLGPGKVVGELALVDRGLRSATCAAHDDAVLLELRQADLEALAADDARRDADLGGDRSQSHRRPAPARCGARREGVREARRHPQRNQRGARADRRSALRRRPS
jgi:CRP-like cAMP-binding protein